MPIKKLYPMYVNLRGNTPTYESRDHVLNSPRKQRSKLKLRLVFSIGYAAGLLYSVWHWISQPTFITNGTVSYKYLTFFGVV